MTRGIGMTPIMEKLGAAVRRAADEFEYATHVRYQVRRFGRQYEVWDTQSSEIQGPFKNAADANAWIRSVS